MALIPPRLLAALSPSPEARSAKANSAAEHAAEVRREIALAAAPTTQFYLMNLFATVIASYGLLSNSAAVVIGAMVIAVLLGPIGGIGLALISADRKLLVRSVVAISSGAIEVLVVSFIIGSLHSSSPITSELLARTQPNLFDLMIALGGGAAGAYALGRRVPGGTMIGVAIATALVPPLASVGIAAAHGSWALAWGAFLLFITNLVAIQCSYSIVLYILRIYRPHTIHGDLRAFVRSLSPTLALLLLLAVFLGVVLQRRIRTENERSLVRSALDSAFTKIQGASLNTFTLVSDDSVFDLVASVRVPEAITPNQVHDIEAIMDPIVKKPVRLTIQSILTKVADHSGYLYQRKELEIVIQEPQLHYQQYDSAMVVRDSIARSDSVMRADSLRVADSTYRQFIADSVKKATRPIPRKRRIRR